MKSVLITGASRGVGRAIALKCTLSGDYNKIIITAHHNKEQLNMTESLMIQAAREAELPIPEIIKSIGDVGSTEYVLSLRTLAGTVDLLINNAAISYHGLLIDMTREEWDEMLNTNITSLYNTCHAFLPDMISRKSGTIINVASVWGRVGASCEVAYSACKGAVDAFTKALAKETAPSGVRVNAISLGMVDTDMNSIFTDEDKASIEEEIPVGRMASPEEAADAILKIVEMPDYLTGSTIRFDGAWY